MGDIVGKPGRQVVEDMLPGLIDQYDPLFVVVNGENAASGFGITPEIAQSLYKQGVDAITLGNHAFNRKDIYGFLDSGAPIVRPSNLPAGNPGKGWITLEKGGVRLAVINLSGRVFMDSYDDPFRAIERIFPELHTNHVLIDFHAEATSEKAAFGFHVEGRATAVLGTHTHVQTADERVLPGGTAYITDVGMCGPWPSVIGMDKGIVLTKFITGLPSRFEVADEPGVISGVVIDVKRETGRATGIARI